MIGGLEKTWRVLAVSPNESAVDLLLISLDSPTETLVAGSVRCLVDRRSSRGMAELVRRWDRLSTSCREIIAERPDRLAGALRDALVQGDSALGSNACHAAIWLREYELAQVLINVAEATTHPHSELAAKTLLRLAELLYEEMTSPRDRTQARDPQAARTRMAAALEKSLLRWALHQRREILEAFLLLSSRDNSTLKRILDNPHDPTYLKTLELLAQSRQAGIMRLLISFLDDRRPSTAALQTLARRSDKTFLAGLVKKVGYEPSTAARRNLKLIRDFPWLRSEPEKLDGLDEAGQHAVVQMAVASSMKRSDVFATLERLLRHGRPGGRRAAAEALRQFQGADAGRLVLAALHDSDPLVQTAVLSHVRQRNLPGAMTRLLELLESNHETVRTATRKCLGDFNCERFLMSFDTLSAESRQSTGALVAKIDLHATSTLKNELASPSRNRRIRAVEAAADLGLVSALEEPLLGLLQENDHLLRARTVEVLRYCNTPRTRQALRERLLDAHPTVQSAAESSLLYLSRSEAALADTVVIPSPVHGLPPIVSQATDATT